MKNICIRNAYKNIYFLKNVRALIDRPALTSWKIGNYFSSLFLTSTSGEHGGGSEPKRMFGGCSDRAALEFPLEISSTSLYICHKLSSVRTFASQRERVQLASSTRLIIMAAVFDRFVIPSSHARLVSRTRVSIPMYYSIPYPLVISDPPGSSLSRAERKSRGLEERMIPLAGFVTRNWTRSTNGKHSVPISNALFFTFVLNRFFKLHVKLRSFHRTDN